MQKIAVAMSGGVDSSVAAALLKRAGFNVIGIHLKLWPGSFKPETMARAVAKKLDIPFYVLNFEKEFKKEVVSRFLKDFNQGLTPNPCVVCNKEIKFGLMLKKAKSLGASLIATGHYARVKKTKEGFKILKGFDKNKDQSYFLYKLNQDILKCVIFPVGQYTKEEVRALAKKFSLPSMYAPESQEACFIPKGLAIFLKKHLKPESGKMVDERGRFLGIHPGSSFYTIGQRKGIGLPAGPYFVLGKKKNTLVLTKDERKLLRKELKIKQTHWVLKPCKNVQAKIRYRSKAEKAVVSGNKVVFSKPQRAITPGQSIVYYNNSELLGGSIIC
ncbi:tRNA 2-thiouridine(34) synthase MnmA [Patescibacteria group bacterium]|nr:tRNA 2-thiouridine(34) synthase MnmA [Patescibacteria group bacterium]